MWFGRVARAYARLLAQVHGGVLGFTVAYARHGCGGPASAHVPRPWLRQGLLLYFASVPTPILGRTCACHQAQATAVRIRTAVGVPQRGKGGGTGWRPVTGDRSEGMPAGGLIFDRPRRKTERQLTADSRPQTRPEGRLLATRKAWKLPRSHRDSLTWRTPSFSLLEDIPQRIRWKRHGSVPPTCCDVLLCVCLSICRRC